MVLSMTMNLFCCMKETSRRIQHFHMKTAKDSTQMRWTTRNAKLNFDSQKMKFQDYLKHWIFLEHFFATKAEQLPE